MPLSYPRERGFKKRLDRETKTKPPNRSISTLLQPGVVCNAYREVSDCVEGLRKAWLTGDMRIYG